MMATNHEELSAATKECAIVHTLQPKISKLDCHCHTKKYARLIAVATIYVYVAYFIYYVYNNNHSTHCWKKYTLSNMLCYYVCYQTTRRKICD